MADQLVIAGVKPYDGSYDLNLGTEFSTREWGWIKRFAGYLPVTLTDDSFSDPELVATLAVIVLHRQGRVETSDAAAVYERFQDTPFGRTVTIKPDPDAKAAEGDADGPPERSSNENEPSSGDNGRTNSETSPPTPSASGIPGSASSPSDPTTSVT